LSSQAMGTENRLDTEPGGRFINDLRLVVNYDLHKFTQITIFQ